MARMITITRPGGIRMSERARSSAAPVPGTGSQALGYRTKEEWEDLLGYAGQLIEGLEEIEDDALRSRVFECLQAVDAIHRESVTRLVRLFKDGVLEQVIADPAIRTLMEMYDLLPATSPCAKIYDFLSPAEPPEQHGRVSERKVSPRVPIPHWVPVPTPAAELGPDASPETVTSWNSLAHVEFLMALEIEFGHRFSPRDIMSISNLGQAVDVLQRKVA